MADYFPLLARALDTMADRSDGTRAIVYERARSALLSQLRSLDPPLGEAEIERETIALDDAITRAEAVYGAEAPPRAEPEAPTLPETTEAASDAARRPRVEAQQLAIRRGGRRNRSLALAVGLGIIMVPVAVVGWLWRDRPVPAPQEIARVEPPAPAAPADSKFADRIGGSGRAAPAVPTVIPAPSAPARSDTGATPEAPREAARSAAPAQTLPAQPELAVAQRALLVEENIADPQQPTINGGRALWRLDALNGGQGQPLETVVRATVDMPDSGLSLVLTLRRNTDPAFPASHTIELLFTAANPGDQNRIVRDVALPQLKVDEATRGIALAGLSVPVKENIFLIGLSDLKGDIDRNSDLLLHRAWIDLPLRFASGQRAVLSFEKGVSGERVLADAFRQWQPQ
jgi:hypothetical protein